MPWSNMRTKIMISNRLPTITDGLGSGFRILPPLIWFTVFPTYSKTVECSGSNVGKVNMVELSSSA